MCGGIQLFLERRGEVAALISPGERLKLWYLENKCEKLGELKQGPLAPCRFLSGGRVGKGGGGGGGMRCGTVLPPN